MEAPRYTAKEIEDGLYSGMDPDVELVAAQYYDALTAERDELRRRLDAVVAIVGLEQQGEFEDWPAGEHIRALRDVRAIAEGREG
jgi:hypothetical protein